jgi:glycolate oxidase iron-sulfur subunit
MATPTTVSTPPSSTPAGPPRPGVLAELEYGQLLQCVHCGLCLPSCPTYAELGQEPDSPRGRIYLIKALADGRIELSDSAAGHLSLCLGGRACESACPSGVQYGHLIEAGRAELETRRPGSPLRRLIRRAAFEGLLPRPRLLRAVAGALRQEERAPAPRPGAGRPPPDAGELLAARRRCAAVPPAAPARLRGRRHRGDARLRRLAHGCVRVVFRRARPRPVPRRWRGEVWCRAPQTRWARTPGEPETARALARATIAAFDAAEVEAVVVNTAGCGAHMKAYGHLLRADPAWAARAAAFARKVLDVTEFLARAPLAGPLGPLPLRATYHDPCHLAHGQKVRGEPRALLRAVPGLELVELGEAEMCCGSAGIYNLTEPAMARRLLDRKMAHIEATGAATVVTANPGCILQLAAGLRARGRDGEVLHVVEVLDRAYAAAERPAS